MWTHLHYPCSTIILVTEKKIVGTRYYIQSYNSLNVQINFLFWYLYIVLKIEKEPTWKYISISSIEMQTHTIKNIQKSEI